MARFETYLGQLVSATLGTFVSIQEMGGWKTLSMVQRYAHLSPDYLQLHAQILSDFVRHSGDDDTNLAQQL